MSSHSRGSFNVSARQDGGEILIPCLQDPPSRRSHCRPLLLNWLVVSLYFPRRAFSLESKFLQALRSPTIIRVKPWRLLIGVDGFDVYLCFVGFDNVMQGRL